MLETFRRLAAPRTHFDARLPASRSFRDDGGRRRWNKSFVCTPRAELSVSLSLPASTVARFPSLENTGFPLFGFFSFSLPPPGFLSRLLLAPSRVSVVPLLSPSMLPSFFFLAHSCVFGGLVFVCWLTEPN